MGSSLIVIRVKYVPPPCTGCGSAKHILLKGKSLFGSNTII